MINRRLLVVLLFVGCDKSAEQATEHMRSLGFKNVACSSEADGTAVCIADEAHYHCVILDRSGCERQRSVACERFYLERSTP